MPTEPILTLMNLKYGLVYKPPHIQIINGLIILYLISVKIYQEESIHGRNQPQANIGSTANRCVIMDVNQNQNANGIGWISTECDDEIPRRSICNSCAGKLNKYIALYDNVIDVGYNYFQAQLACDNHYGTTLASIHSNRDYLEAKELCSLIGEDCWIGLNDIASEGKYIYDDGTEFDFAAINGNNVNKDCIRLSSSDNYGLNDYLCDGTGIHYALCHLSSLLCDSWTTSS